LIGLGTCQIIASFQIYLANQSLVNKVQGIEASGGFHVPSLSVLSQALDFSTIFISALFITLSLGVGLSLLTLSYLHFTQDREHLPKATTISFGVLWLVLLGLVNAAGFCAFCTAYLVLVPLSILILTVITRPAPAQKDLKASRWIRWGVLLFLLFLWTIQISEDSFTHLRDSFLLSHPLGESITAVYYQFTFYPASVLESQSQQFNTLRILIYLSVLIALPVLAYYLVYGVVRLFISPLMTFPGNSITASLVCLFIGLLLLGRLWLVQTIQVEDKDLTQFLNSEQLDQRVAALRSISTQNLDLSQYTGYRGVQSSTVSVERLWFARALASSQGITATQDITDLLADQNLSVVCAALASLGKRRETKAIEIIQGVLYSTPEWYLQKCAYQSLKKLGWNP
jgi:hypothetical protein